MNDAAAGSAAAAAPPCYSASAFHAFDLGGASVCAMGAIEEGFSAEDVVFDVLDQLASGDGRVAP